MIGWQRMSDFFVKHFGDEPEIACCAPGRINLIGEHIDYAGGQVLRYNLPTLQDDRPDGMISRIGNFLNRQNVRARTGQF